jgi:hypothetical protein
LLQLKTWGAINTHSYYFGALPFPNYIRASPWKIACLACRIPNNARLSHHAFMKTFQAPTSSGICKTTPISPPSYKPLDAVPIFLSLTSMIWNTQ